MIDLDNIDNPTLFYYIILCIITLYFFSTKDIKLNFVFGFVICCMVIYHLNTKNQNKKLDHENQVKDKVSLVLPKSKNAVAYEEITDFLYSIQDFYIYNPQAYAEFMENLDTFFDIYEVSKINPVLTGQYYNHMEMYKRSSMNSLQSMIHTIPSSVGITNKLSDAIRELEGLLNIYLDKTERGHDLYLFKNGININTKLIEKNLVPSNSFEFNEHGDGYNVSENYSLF